MSNQSYKRIYPICNCVNGYKKGWYVNAIAKGREAAEFLVTGRLPYVILLPEQDENQNPFFVALKTSKYSAEVCFKKHVVNQQVGPLSFAVEDRFGEFSYSTFAMRVVSHQLDGETLESALKVKGEYQPEHAYEIATELLRHLTDIYRHTWIVEAFRYPEELRRFHRKDWLPELNVKRLSPWQNLIVRDKYGDELFQYRHKDYRGTGVAIGTSFKEDGLKRFQHALMHEYDEGIDGYIRIINRHFHNGDYEAVCIMSTAVIEKQVFHLLSQKLDMENVDPHRKQKVLFKEQKVRNTDKYQRRGIVDAMKHYFGNANFKNWNEWKACDELLFQTRNEIIHGDVIRVDRQLASSMIEAANSFLEVFEKRL